MSTDEELNAILEDLKPKSIAPSAGLQRRVAEIPARHPRRSMSLWGLFAPRQWWGLATGAAMAMMLGGVSGWTLDENASGELAEQEVEAEWEELSSLALAADLDGELE